MIKNSIKISYKQVTTRFIAPIQTFALHLDKANKKQPVHSIDVTDGGLGVSSSTDGSLLIWTQKDGQIRVGILELFTKFHQNVFQIVLLTTFSEIFTAT